MPQARQSAQAASVRAERAGSSLALGAGLGVGQDPGEVLRLGAVLHHPLAHLCVCVSVRGGRAERGCKAGERGQAGGGGAFGALVRCNAPQPAMLGMHAHTQARLSPLCARTVSQSTGRCASSPQLKQKVPPQLQNTSSASPRASTRLSAAFPQSGGGSGRCRGSGGESAGALSEQRAGCSPCPPPPPPTRQRCCPPRRAQSLTWGGAPGHACIVLHIAPQCELIILGGKRGAHHRSHQRSRRHRLALCACACVEGGSGVEGGGQRGKRRVAGGALTGRQHPSRAQHPCKPAAAAPSLPASQRRPRRRAQERLQQPSQGPAS